MMEHYWAIGRAENKKSDNSEDYARAIMGGYEAVYHEIMKIHETGDREFSSLYGKGTVTLEEDLRALDLAFEKRAKKEFEESYQSRGYQKFTGSNIISRIISENPEFSFKTKLLFFEVK